MQLTSLASDDLLWVVLFVENYMEKSGAGCDCVPNTGEPSIVGEHLKLLLHSLIIVSPEYDNLDLHDRSPCGFAAEWSAFRRDGS